MSQTATPPPVGTIPPPPPPPQALMAAPPVPMPSPAPVRYEPDEQRRSPFWQVVRWPFHQALKVIFLAVSWAGRDRRRAVVVGLLLVGLIVGAVALAQRDSTMNSALVGAQPGGTGAPTASGFTITYYTKDLPPLPASVYTMMKSLHDYDAHSFWSTLDPSAQQTLEKNGESEQTFVQAFAKAKSDGVSYPQFYYTGGFASPDGTWNYMVQVIIAQGTHAQVDTWYFVVINGGQIYHFANVSALIASTTQGN